MNDVLSRIEVLMKEREWSLYMLAKQSEIPYSSLSSLFKKNNQPTISTLEKICNGFHITLEEFFSYVPPYRDETSSLSKDELSLLENYRSLNRKDKKLLSQFIVLLTAQE